MERHECVTKCYEVPGQTWPTELCWLYDEFSKSRSHAEIGTYCGRSLLASCGGMSLDALVISVDNDSETIDAEWSRSVRSATLRMIGPVVTKLEMGSLDAALHCQNAAMQFDSIFIDASHHYADCKADIEAWLPLLRPGGIISGHDYWTANTGVMCAVNDVFKDRFEVVPQTRIWFARPITS